MPTGEAMSLIRNPFNTSEVWITNWQTRRRVGPDEFSLWTFLGADSSFAPSWFFQIPVATG
jgi:hypothetical protein